jgi:hypothetical protein
MGILFPKLGGRGGRKRRINICREVGSEAKGGNCVSLNGAASEGGSMLVSTIGAFEWDGVTASGCGFVVPSFNSALISTAVGIAGVGERADVSGWGIFFAELGWVAELAAVAALSDKRGGEHLFGLVRAGEQADVVF